MKRTLRDLVSVPIFRLRPFLRMSRHIDLGAPLNNMLDRFTRYGSSIRAVLATHTPTYCAHSPQLSHSMCAYGVGDAPTCVKAAGPGMSAWWLSRSRPDGKYPCSPSSLRASRLDFLAPKSCRKTGSGGARLWPSCAGTWRGVSLILLPHLCL